MQEIYFPSDIFTFCSVLSRDSDLTSTNVSLSVCLQYVEIACKQKSPVIHESHP